MMPNVSKIFFKVITNLSFIIISSFIIGIHYQNLAIILYPFLFYINQGIIFTSIVCIDSSEFNASMKAHTIVKSILLCIVRLIILPFIIYFLLQYVSTNIFYIQKDIIIGLTLKFATAPTFGIVSIAQSYKGNASTALVMASLSNIMMIATVSFIFGSLHYGDINFSFEVLSKDIANIILPPIITGLLFRRLLPKYNEKLKHYCTNITKILWCFYLVAACNGLYNILYNNLYIAITTILMAAILYIMLTLIGWIISFKEVLKDKISNCMLLSITSASSLLFAHLWFANQPVVILTTILTTLSISSALITLDILLYFTKK